MSFNVLIPVHYQALISIVPLDSKTTKCNFQNIFNGSQFNMTLAVTKDQIISWSKGKPVQYAINNVSKEIQELFITGCTDKEFSKLLNSV